MMHYPSKELIESEIAKIRGRGATHVTRESIANQFERDGFPRPGDDVIGSLLRHYQIEI